MVYALQILLHIIMIVCWGVMGIEIFAHGMRNLTLIEVCACITIACLVGNLICALYRVWKKKS